MNSAQVASGIARTFESDLPDREQMLRSGIWLGSLDGISEVEARERARVCAAVIRLTVADRADASVELAFDWRRPLANLFESFRRIELLYKGFYAVNAAARVAGASDRVAAFHKERLYHRQHLDAAEHRHGIWLSMDSMRGIYGDVLGWYSVLEPSTTPECRAAHGQNFRVTVPPAIGYPGMVHGKCKCTPGRPHAGGAVLP